MNWKEWKELCKVDKAKAHYWYNKVKKKRLSKEFESLENCDKDATVIHHLRDTEEQRKYNDEHYEMFGLEIDENGHEHFEYGKYVVFWTKEHHDEYHSCSEETRKKRSASIKKAYENAELRERCSKSHKGIKCKEETRKKIGDANRGENNHMYGKHHSEEAKQKISESLFGENNPRYGKHCTEEHKRKISESRIGHEVSDETREKISDTLKSSDKHPWRNKQLPDYVKQKISDTKKNSYHPYRGAHLSEEHRTSISESLKGHSISEETKSKISESLRGHAVSEETRHKLSMNSARAMLGKTHSDETRKLISDSKKLKVSLYNRYKSLGGCLIWNDFQKYIADIYDNETDSFNLEFKV